jgi:hypothetical protein
MSKPILLLPLALLVAACNYQPQPSDQAVAPAATPDAAAPIAEAPAASSATLTFTPAAFEACDPPEAEVATIRWDASESGAQAVDVVIVGADGSTGTFASGDVVGEKDSGAWMQPGVVIAVRDHASGNELARTVAGSLPCSR